MVVLTLSLQLPVGASAGSSGSVRTRKECGFTDRRRVGWSETLGVRSGVGEVGAGVSQAPEQCGVMARLGQWLQGCQPPRAAPALLPPPSWLRAQPGRRRERPPFLFGTSWGSGDGARVGARSSQRLGVSRNPSDRPPLSLLTSESVGSFLPGSWESGAGRPGPPRPVGGLWAWGVWRGAEGCWVRVCVLRCQGRRPGPSLLPLLRPPPQ